MQKNSINGTDALDGKNIGKDAFDTGGHWGNVTTTLANWSGISYGKVYASRFYVDFTEADRYAHTTGRLPESAVRLSSTTDVKNRIMENGSITAAYYHDFDKYESRENSSYYCPVRHTVNHAITVIGWDDNYGRNGFNEGNRPSSDGAWLCKNSWGNYNSLDGFF